MVFDHFPFLIINNKYNTHLQIPFLDNPNMDLSS
jgi:hypothetical protein